MSLEERFNPTFTATLALREKQIQQNYRPVIGVHKWFARRPGSLLRNLLLAEFNGEEPPELAYFRAHKLSGVIADPFMGGGTTLIEANRLGFDVIGADINPIAWWLVRQELGPLDLAAFTRAADEVAGTVATMIDDLYKTSCLDCGQDATVKYFIWVKTQACPHCGRSNDLFPGYLLAEATRHPRHVLACSDCTRLVELDSVPHSDRPARCSHCGGRVQVEGPARHNQIACRGCGQPFRYPASGAGPPEHRLWAIEYHCGRCKPRKLGRFFKGPDSADLRRFELACVRFESADGLHIPNDHIPAGDETTRLHRWGYRYYREMFNPRQLLGLGLLRQRLLGVPDSSVRHALLTVFSDFLRYQNMLCRYDTYALKCQDIFSVHGFPVGLVQCENNVLGIPGVGSGAFRHFIEKYRRAKEYCAEPFETTHVAGSKRVVPIKGEYIGAQPTDHFPDADVRQAWLVCGSARCVDLPPNSLDGVFTDPPYFANVQYAELMDFCYVWLRQSIENEFPEFGSHTTRTPDELTGNETWGRGLEHFAEGLSRIFVAFAAALKPGAPFVFTYHHNQLDAYAPLVLALLDAGLACTAALPAPAEMTASLHINNTGSSILDSVFVARRAELPVIPTPDHISLRDRVAMDLLWVAAGGVWPTLGDARCLTSGHLARLSIEQLRPTWSVGSELATRLAHVQVTLSAAAADYEPETIAAEALAEVATVRNGSGLSIRSTQGRLFSEASDVPIA